MTRDEAMFSVCNEGKFFFAKNAGKISEEEFQKALKGIVTGAGACPMIGTAITMQTLFGIPPDEKGEVFENPLVP